MSYATDRLHQISTDRADRLHQISMQRTDHYVRWLAGILLANLTATAGIFARLMLS
jgi:hypothetical protein